MVRFLQSLVLLLPALWAGPSAASGEAAAPGAGLQRITVQLSWSHQTEFAGFYLAQRQKHFAAEGLEVVLEPGNARENPIDVLQAGRADVAISAFRGAIERSDAQRPVTNIAQIFQSSPLVVMCRPSLGVAAAQDMRGKTLGVAGGGDVPLLRQMLAAIGSDGSDVKLVPRDGTGRLLIQGEAACITGVTFNEMLRVLNAGVPSSDLLIISPESLGVTDMGDGLYVRTERLQSEAFRRQLVGLLRALEKGWREAREYPSLAVAATLERNPQLNQEFQRQALEQVLSLVPPKDFGLFRPSAIQAMEASAAPLGSAAPLPDYIWTHRVWNEWQRADGRAGALTPATRHALARFAAEPLFTWLVLIGSVMFGLGGCLLGIERGYNFWGRLFVALLPAMGGGVIRDLLIGGPRLPLYFISDPTLPLCVLAVVLLTSALVAFYPQLPRTRAFAQTMFYSDVIGCAVIATNGGIAALNASVPWIWAPVFAAISCTGGGLLQDIVTNHAPKSFRGRQFEDEERALIAGFAMVGGLWCANLFEHSMLLVYLSPVAAIALNLAVRFNRDRLMRYYPAWLTAATAPRAQVDRRQ